MNIFKALLRDFSLKRMLVVLVLTTLATVLVEPHFGHEIAFHFLWSRLFVVALVMLVCYSVAGLLHERAARARLSRAQAQFVALGVGALVGPVVSGLLIGRSIAEMATVEPIFWGMVFFTAVAMGLGTAAASLLVYRERAARAQTRIARAESEQNALQRQVLEARLKLMQAQIEPHFLFNTLANVQHLIETDPPLANRLLESLITYLRSALPQMREEGTTLGREVDLVHAYLTIQQLRMGGRLQFQAEVPAAMRERRVPPMMLMTLVENAIKHGIDPLQQGGEIRLSASETAGRLEICVADTGQGLTHGSGGVGLQNIRERLAAIHGLRARLILEENAPRGVVARLQLPADAPQADALLATPNQAAASNTP